MKKFELKFELDSLRWEDVKRLLILATPYICMGLFMTIVGKLGEYRPEAICRRSSRSLSGICRL